MSSGLSGLATYLRRSAQWAEEVASEGKAASAEARGRCEGLRHAAEQVERLAGHEQRLALAPRLPRGVAR